MSTLERDLHEEATAVNGTAAPATRQDAETAATLARLERGLEAQERRVRNAIGLYGVFAVAALLIALANLVAVAAKLDGKSSTPKAAATVAPRAAAPAPAAAAGSIGVRLKEFRILPTSTRGRAGKLTFRVRNTGRVTHEFVVLRTPTAAAALKVKAGRADETGNVGETGDLAPGRAKSVTLNLKPGHYALICNLPGHYLSGQRTDFTVVR